MKYDFLVETYETERIKVISVWSEFKDEDFPVRLRPGDPRGRSVHEQMVHQCVSEDVWFRTMLGIDVGAPPLPVLETRLEFVKRYAEDSGKRLAALREKEDAWWEGETKFLRCPALADMGDGTTLDSHFAPPRATIGDASHAGSRPAQQLRPDRRYRWPDAIPCTDDLRLP